MPEKIGTREALDAHAQHLQHLKQTYGIKHNDGIALLSLVLNYDITLRQMSMNPFGQQIQREESDGK